MKVVDIEYLPNDVETIRVVASWLHSEWGHLNPGSTLETAVQRISQRAGHARKIPWTMIAREEGSPVGTASLVANDMTTRLDLAPWLASVYVLPTHRRRGVGAALCRRVVQEAFGLGFHRIYLFTPSQQHFYKTLGWEEIENTAYRSETVTIMTHALDGHQS
ncbi:MAG TPA: GNAT family N-acetyltransferase [Verrucomicrobiae bacterium]|jgi:N-acetylglutamate synthase-like GNAT family acetyltransferase|nr:GNAT family N-acetyltransferase [Verrucomicrobiae bacterium]